VLSGGALPMDVLSTRIHTWVAQQKTQASLLPAKEAQESKSQNQ